MKKAGLVDEDLSLAVSEMEHGLIDADLGGGLVKKRIALPGRGKRGSTRTIVGTNWRDRWIFIFGFAKNEMETISVEARRVLQKEAADFLDMSVEKLWASVERGSLQEVGRG